MHLRVAQGSKDLQELGSARQPRVGTDQDPAGDPRNKPSDTMALTGTHHDSAGKPNRAERDTHGWLRRCCLAVHRHRPSIVGTELPDGRTPSRNDKSSSHRALGSEIRAASAISRRPAARSPGTRTAVPGSAAGDLLTSSRYADRCGQAGAGIRLPHDQEEVALGAGLIGIQGASDVSTQDSSPTCWRPRPRSRPQARSPWLPRTARVAPPSAATGSVVLLPASSTAQPSGMLSPRFAWSMILPIDTSAVAMSRTSGCGSAGTPTAIGFDPTMAGRPPQGAPMPRWCSVRSRPTRASLCARHTRRANPGDSTC